MINERPLLTVLIPTKNRYYTLLPLCSYLQSKEGDFEVVITDNSSDNSEYIGFFNELDSRFKYLYEPRTLTMRENCERGVNIARGKYITMLGDDDGIIIDNAIECISYLESNHLDFALSPACKYLWPNLKTRIFGTKSYGILRDCDYLSEKIRINSRDELKKVARYGGTKIIDLPRFYQGIVKTKFLHDSMKEFGTILLASMPDMSSSVLLAKKTEFGVKYDMPFIINGVSSNSGGGLGARGKHKGKLEDGYGLSRKDIEEWPNNVPRFWSGGTVWAASFQITLSKVEKDSDVLLNESALAAYCIVFHHKLALSLGKPFLKKNLSLGLIGEVSTQISHRLASLVRNFLFYSFKVKNRNINNIKDAIISIETEGRPNG
ncbi:glycosyltransferase [Ferrimonas kyonanensis]|uniref:glycosyltransferase n=1 Tax=Ferrimonas kyonanensis TaxID=364763 RepID=UPI0004148B0A|nr:glycosyltransferase [Ferrimonas kyonanensis]